MKQGTIRGHHLRLVRTLKYFERSGAYEDIFCALKLLQLNFELDSEMRVYVGFIFLFKITKSFEPFVCGCEPHAMPVHVL